MSPDKGTDRLVELIKAAIWPALVLIAMILFYSPVHRTLDSVARRSEDIQTFKVGSFELSIRAHDLLVPPSNVAEALKGAGDPAVVAKLIEDLTLDRTCYAVNEQSDPRFQRDFRLFQLGLIKLERDQAEDTADCPHSYTLFVTPPGHSTADFVLRLISAEIAGIK